MIEIELHSAVLVYEHLVCYNTNHIIEIFFFPIYKFFKKFIVIYWGE